MRKPILVLLLSLLCTNLYAQHLQTQFSKAEYLELLKINARQNDSSYYNKLPAPEKFIFNYRSPVVGLDNRWDLWISKDSIAVISIRGTTQNSVSWLANFYAAMVPAKGSLTFSKDKLFNYNLCSDSNAAIHIGWLISTAFLSETIVPKIDSCYQSGIKEFIIMGHSQGGAIAYLVTAYLYNLRSSGTISKNIRFKTYCSAGPKPGNLAFAYYYESITRKEGAYNIVNAADWVPETPISIQTATDFNPTNPFTNAKKSLKKQKFPANLVLNYAYKKLTKPTSQAQKNYEKYLGNTASTFVRKHIPGYVEPMYYRSNHYVRTGNFIVLYPNNEYYKLFPNSQERVFVHHLFEPYLYLTNLLQE